MYNREAAKQERSSKMRQIVYAVMALTIMLMPVKAMGYDFSDAECASVKTQMSMDYETFNSTYTPYYTGQSYNNFTPLPIPAITPIPTFIIPSYDSYINSGTCALGPLSSTGYYDTMRTLTQTSVPLFNEPTNSTTNLFNSIANIFSPTEAHAFDPLGAGCLGGGVAAGIEALVTTFDKDTHASNFKQAETYKTDFLVQQGIAHKNMSSGEYAWRGELYTDFLAHRRNFLVGMGIKNNDILFSPLVSDFQLPCEFVNDIQPCTYNYKGVDVDEALRLENDWRMNTSQEPLKLNSIINPIHQEVKLSGLHNTATDFLGGIFSPTEAHAWDYRPNRQDIIKNYVYQKQNDMYSRTHDTYIPTPGINSIPSYSVPKTYPLPKVPVIDTNPTYGHGLPPGGGRPYTLQPVLPAPKINMLNETWTRSTTKYEQMYTPPPIPVIQKFEMPNPIQMPISTKSLDIFRTTYGGKR